MLVFKTNMEVKNEKFKNIIIRVLAVVTVILHFSDVYVSFFTTGTADVGSEHLLPIYPCHILMWLLLICAFLKNRNNKAAKVLQEFTFFAGIVCGSLGILFNERFDSHPTLTDWNTLKGLLSHSTLIMGCIYLLVARFIKIRVSNTISVFLGLCLFLVDGYIINGLYKVFGLGECNSMYLQKPPLEGLEWFSTWFMGMLGIAIVFIITVLYEWLALKKEDRWYVILKNKINDLKNKKKKGVEDE